MADLMITLRDKYKIVVTGGGDIAQGVIKKLYEYTKKIIVVSKNIDPFFKNFMEVERIQYYEKNLRKNDLIDINFVVICDEDKNARENSIRAAKKAKIPVWVFGEYEKSSFIMPTIIKMSDIVIGISSSGVSCELETVLKTRLNENLNRKVTGIIRRLKSKKDYYNTRVKPAHRKAFWEELIDYSIDNLHEPNAFEKKAGELFVKYSKMV